MAESQSSIVLYNVSYIDIGDIANYNITQFLVYFIAFHSLQNCHILFTDWDNAVLCRLFIKG